MKVIEVNGKNFEAEVLASSKPVIVDFNAEWCGPCRMMRPVLDRIAAGHEDIRIAAVNVDSESELAERYGIYSIPCLIAFKNGKEIGRSIGLTSEEDVLALVNQA